MKMHVVGGLEELEGFSTVPPIKEHDAAIRINEMEYNFAFIANEYDER